MYVSNSSLYAKKNTPIDNDSNDVKIKNSDSLLASIGAVFIGADKEFPCIRLFSYCAKQLQQRIADKRIHIRAKALFFNRINTFLSYVPKFEWTCFIIWRDKPKLKLIRIAIQAMPQRHSRQVKFDFNNENIKLFYKLFLTEIL